MKIAVYGIAKDEEQNVQGWVESALEEADYAVLLDTGSTDDTVKIAKKAGAMVSEANFMPFRFDDARNASLALVPSDVDVCAVVDMDERLQPGWREEIEKRMGDAGCVKISTVFMNGDQETLRYNQVRFHTRDSWRWKGAAHETLVFTKEPVPKTEVIPEIELHHRQQPKDRMGRDYGLLEMNYKENPNDTRAMYYLARQYYYNNEWDKARKLFTKYLDTGGWDQERSQACQFMYEMVFDDFKEYWLLRAMSEAPNRREPWYELAIFYFQKKMYQEVIGFATRMMRIKEKDETNSFHIVPAAWDNTKTNLMIIRARRAIEKNENNISANPST